MPMIYSRRISLARQMDLKDQSLVVDVEPRRILVGIIAKIQVSYKKSVLPHEIKRGRGEKHYHPA